MIKLASSKHYKSISPIEIELPDFTILTGINGSGKSQILKGILSEEISLMDNSDVDINPKKFYTANSISPNSGKISTSNNYQIKSQLLWKSYNEYLEKKKVENSLSVKNYFDELSPQFKTIQKISEISNKDIDKLTYPDFINYFPIKYEVEQNDLFKHNLSDFIKSYLDRIEENDYHEFLNKKYKDLSFSFISNEEFIKTHGNPPWIKLNEIFETLKLEYRIPIPNTEEYRKKKQYEVSLKNTVTDTKIGFMDLSSGEKTIISLCLSLFNLQENLKPPQVLLLDEPDALLHPSMAKIFLKFITDVFINQYQLKVIMSTHSASTIALAPEESIYVVNNKDKDVITKSSKDEALKILTKDIPSFSVNYENRRQVFVESTNDVIFFEKLYRILSFKLHPEISFSFISSGESRTDKNGSKVSNCEQVENITNILRDSGNKFVWGIIDWDLKEKTRNDFVKILGKKNRYSIENYIFDPLLVGALLLSQKIIKKSDVDLMNGETFIDMRSFKEEKLQKISDFVISKIRDKFSPESEEFQECKLLNEKSINIPIWYLQMQGHKLEEIIINSFPELNSIKRGREEALKIEVLDKIIDDLPELLSIDLLNTFQSIQE